MSAKPRKLKRVKKRKAKVRPGARKRARVVAVWPPVAGFVPYREPVEEPPPPPPPPPPEPLAGPVVVSIELFVVNEGDPVSARFVSLGLGAGGGAALQVAARFYDPVGQAFPLIYNGQLTENVQLFEPMEEGPGTDARLFSTQGGLTVAGVQPQAWDGTTVEFAFRWASQNEVVNLWSEPFIRVVAP